MSAPDSSTGPRPGPTAPGRSADDPPTTASTTWRVLTGLAVLSVLGYAVVIAGQLLLGTIAAALVYLCSWLVATLRDRGYSVSVGTRRMRLVALFSPLVMLYALLVAGQILLGVLAVAVLFLVAWVTSPEGPLASR